MLRARNYNFRLCFKIRTHRASQRFAVTNSCYERVSQKRWLSHITMPSCAPGKESCSIATVPKNCPVSTTTITLMSVAATLLVGHYSQGAAAEESDVREEEEMSAEEARTVDLFERCSASVVHINTFVHGIVRAGRGYHLDLQEIPQGTGSGFVWDAQHIVTNYHVIKDADKATVVLSDNTTCEATLVGAEPDCDLAVLRIRTPTDSSASEKQRVLIPLRRGKSYNLRVGQRVFAIGNPFGLDQTLTSGIVSGLGREMRGITGQTIPGLVQTDAAINPGNSGGPLLDAKGRLVGVNTMIASPSGAFAGVGFAIPVDSVVRVVQQLLVYGRRRRAYLGLALAPDHVTQRLLRRPRSELGGVLILNVEPGSPADNAGLKPMYQTDSSIMLSDEIIAIDGTQVSTAESLAEAIDSRNVGDEVQVVFKRHSSPATNQDTSARIHTAMLRLAEMPRGRRTNARTQGGRDGGIRVSETQG
mmetsp:Transcript_14831/g.29240  ORF Transcript_14831/g.29240 Transcript_14831/m.29240 type:complete len:474 (-) Transcript_14831:292-1713(-)